MNTLLSTCADSTRRIARWLVAATVSSALFSATVCADDNAAARQAFRPAAEHDRPGNALGSRAPSPETSVSANVTFRSVSEQSPRATADFTDSGVAGGAAALAFRPPLGEHNIHTTSAAPSSELVYSLSNPSKD